VDVQFEGTAAGLAAQEDHVHQIVGTANASTDVASAWGARERLWDWRDGAIARLSVLPADVATTLVHLAELGRRHGATWQAVMQATGLGLVRLDGAGKALRDVLLAMRQRAEADGGSLVVLRQPAGGEPLDAWGNAGDALPLMRAVKAQLDPRATLNPGRFVGGI
jgi:glycolate oxidase FAD binding subunit